jgi:hypothetical protein
MVRQDSPEFIEGFTTNGFNRRFPSGAACSFVGRNNAERTGTCFTPNADRHLACRPAHGAKGQGGQSKEQGSGGHGED